MRLRICAFFFLVSTSFAQFTNITATITDPDGQLWANGNVQIIFVPTPGVPGPFTCQGTTNFPQKVNRSINSSGTFTITIPDNNFCSPACSQWQFQLCSNTSAPCQNVTIPVTGANTDLSAVLSARLI